MIIAEIIIDFNTIAGFFKIIKGICTGKMNSNINRSTHNIIINKIIKRK